ncbi:two-component sensor histidine kinase [Anaerocolumna cellulosilytica]|uniref:histidine kinase n=1 Tax=Anaerocolumna cellulosilytica TaxID=433286 RepID=A0A6S6RC52_9FIRM|nr:HAMP domain-containing sensor histidine kinase [Anaerocolumna cellulosilytica]MBB5195328.1 signal transduction histidine kinase [Anaerocolumna cellulosilytica]BCJ96802.1 two-component sensor histidine kinase [Anaerocolumna cellulosilytica]
MKFRTFITTLILFLIILFGSLFFISYSMFRTDMNNIKERGLSEHYFINSAYGKDLKAIIDRGNTYEDSIEPLYEIYADFYKRQGVSLEVIYQGRVLLTNFGDKEMQVETTNPGIRKVSFLQKGDATYIRVMGDIPGTDNQYGLIYLHDITGNLKAWEQRQRILLLIGVISSTVLAISLQILLNRIFQPLLMVASATQKIAAGHYEDRIRLKGRNELTEMAENFNHMAEEIQLRITQLAEASKQKQQFVDNFAHEIRTPLTSVFGFAEYIQKSPIDNEEKIKAAGIIMTESKHMLNISNRLLEMAVLRNIEISGERIEVEQLFDNTRNYMSDKLKVADITLTLSNNIDYFYGDMDLLESLLINLTDNAIKASSPGDSITWETRMEAGKKVLLVKDKGTGIPPEAVGKLTEPFYRVDKSRSREYGGVGLGLSICGFIAELHNAELIFDSNPQEGTTVKLIFTG